MTIDEVLGALLRLDLDPRQKGPAQWLARCPAHDDRRPSLSVGISRDGESPLLHCHRGCQFVDIITALDDGRRVIAEFPQVDNTPDPLPTNSALGTLQEALTPEIGEAVTGLRGWSLDTLYAFHIGYENGRLVMPVYERGRLVQVNRYSPSGKEPKQLALKGRGRYLYHVPTLDTDAPLWIVEGEPDALSAYELGLMGVGVPGVNNWRQEYAERFTGRSVRVCMDCDRAGREAAYRIFADLVPFASSLKVVDLEPVRDDGYDLTDFLMDARKRDELPEARAYLRWLTEH